MSGLRVFFFFSRSLESIQLQFYILFSFFPLHATQRKIRLKFVENSNLFFFFLLLHLCLFTHQIFLFLETNSSTNFPRISKYSRRMPDHVYHHEWKDSSRWTLNTGADFFSRLTHTHTFPRLRIALWHWNWNNRNEFEARKKGF